MSKIPFSVSLNLTRTAIRSLDAGCFGYFVDDSPVPWLKYRFLYVWILLVRASRRSVCFVCLSCLFVFNYFLARLSVYNGWNINIWLKTMVWCSARTMFEQLCEAWRKSPLTKNKTVPDWRRFVSWMSALCTDLTGMVSKVSRCRAIIIIYRTRICCFSY